MTRRELSELIDAMYHRKLGKSGDPESSAPVELTEGQSAKIKAAFEKRFAKK